ncbi:MAG TPA: response regulator [Candidatus Wallbacteria bacterium]|nr:response regulator [Candidatus Wallbacteria bacterium]
MYDLDITGSRILIVDDTPQSLGLLEKMLRDNGYHVFAMTNGEAAIKIAAGSHPELILLDVRMPGMDGYEVCRRLKEIPDLKDISVIFLSALNETEDKIKGFKSGGVDYITKPLQLEEVEARVRTHLTISKLRRELQKHNADLEMIVAERTRELAEAYKRLKSIDQLKSEFLSMISHELRTPLNGILGVSELILMERQKNIIKDDLNMLYKCSRNRLDQLLNDAMMINELDLSPKKANQDAVSLDTILDDPGVHVVIEANAGEQLPKIIGDIVLLKKAFTSILKTSTYFNVKKDKLTMKCEISENAINLCIHLDNLRISEEHAGSFFELASVSRQCSQAQDMGLSPVVARKIVGLFGGDIKMIKQNDSEGEFVLTFLKPTNNDARN